jgi:hypothetical protein
MRFSEEVHPLVDGSEFRTGMLLRSNRCLKTDWEVVIGIYLSQIYSPIS